MVRDVVVRLEPEHALAEQAAAGQFIVGLAQERLGHPNRPILRDREDRCQAQEILDVRRARTIYGQGDFIEIDLHQRQPARVQLQESPSRGEIGNGKPYGQVRPYKKPRCLVPEFAPI